MLQNCLRGLACGFVQEKEKISRECMFVITAVPIPNMAEKAYAQLRRLGVIRAISPVNRAHHTKAETSIVRYDFVCAIIQPAGRHPKAGLIKYGAKIVAILTASVVKMSAICCA